MSKNFRCAYTNEKRTQLEFTTKLKLFTTTTAEEVELVTDREVLEICKSIKDRKASGPDGISNKALKIAIENNVGAFVYIYKSCLSEVTFPPIWKRQRLVLIPKKGKPNVFLSSLMLVRYSWENSRTSFGNKTRKGIKKCRRTFTEPIWFLQAEVNN